MFKIKSAFVMCAYLICICVVVAFGLEHSNLKAFTILPICFGAVLCIALPACSIKE